MNFNILLAFLFGMILLAASPGPGVLASVSKAISESFTASLCLIGGLVLGDIIFLLLAIFGLSAAAKLLGGLFLFIRITGGIYLVFLGVRIISVNAQINFKGKKDKNRLQTFLGGFIVTMGNPKPILFYASVLPAIINFNEVKPLEVFIMVILIALVSFIVLGTYSYIASLSNKFNISGKRYKRINQTAGVIMIIAGLLIILKL
jgi:threonine/homoserine/homoserine lactone efflux protein